MIKMVKKRVAKTEKKLQSEIQKKQKCLDEIVKKAEEYKKMFADAVNEEQRNSDSEEEK